MDAKVDQAGNPARLHSLNRVNGPISVAIACRDEALTVRNRLRLDGTVDSYMDHQNRTRCVKKNSVSTSLPGQQSSQVSTAVSRRNARERKRVRLVNLGFATLRDHVPAGTKTKKLSKVETLRAAISYIRQLQEILGERECDDFQDTMSPVLQDESQENYMSPQSVVLQEENSSASEEMMAEFMSMTRTVNGSNGVSSDAAICSPSPASSTEGSLVASSYDDPPLLDIGSWFT